MLETPLIRTLARAVGEPFDSPSVQSALDELENLYAAPAERLGTTSRLAPYPGVWFTLSGPNKKVQQIEFTIRGRDSEPVQQPITSFIPSLDDNTNVRDAQLLLQDYENELGGFSIPGYGHVGIFIKFELEKNQTLILFDRGLYVSKTSTHKRYSHQ